MRGRAAAMVFLAAGLVPAQGKFPAAGPAESRASLEARAKALVELRRRIEEARIRIDLGLPVDPAFLRSLAPAGNGDPRELRARFAKELDKLAALQARLKDLKVRASRAPARVFRRKAVALPAELKPRPAPPGASGKGRPTVVKTPKKKVRTPAERRPAPLYRVNVDPRLLADALYRKGEFEKALALYRKMGAEKPGDTAVLFRQALCLERTGKRDEALKILAGIKTRKAGTPWEKAAVFAEECILWRKNFDALGPLPPVPKGTGEVPAPKGAGAGR